MRGGGASSSGEIVSSTMTRVVTPGACPSSSSDGPASSSAPTRPRPPTSQPRCSRTSRPTSARPRPPMPRPPPRPRPSETASGRREGRRVTARAECAEKRWSFGITGAGRPPHAHPEAEFPRSELSNGLLVEFTPNFFSLGNTRTSLKRNYFSTSQRPQRGLPRRSDRSRPSRNSGKIGRFAVFVAGLFSQKKYDD